MTDTSNVIASVHVVSISQFWVKIAKLLDPQWSIDGYNRMMSFSHRLMS